MEQDLVDLLVAEHRRIEALFAEFETARTPAARRAALNSAVAALATHANTGRTRLQPVMRAHLPAVLVDYETAEHSRVDALALRVIGLDDGDPEFEPLLASLLEAVREHVQEEETELFPRLRDSAGESLRVTDRADG